MMTRKLLAFWRCLIGEVVISRRQTQVYAVPRHRIMPSLSSQDRLTGHVNIRM